MRLKIESGPAGWKSRNARSTPSRPPNLGSEAMKENLSLLVVEDHPDIAAMVCDYFEERDYIIDYAADGVSGLHLAVSGEFDAIILDLMLPGLDGIEVCRKLRQEAAKSTPILMLTARDTLEDKIEGLNAGADDYLVKPFETAELEARVRAMVRRASGQLVRETLQVDDLKIDTGTLEVTREDKLLSLTPIGLKLLMTLIKASPKVVTRRELERSVWGDIVPDSDALRSHLYNLRKIIDRPFETPLLHTIAGSGYRLVRLDDN